MPLDVSDGFQQRLKGFLDRRVRTGTIVDPVSPGLPSESREHVGERWGLLARVPWPDGKDAGTEAVSDLEVPVDDEGVGPVSVQGSAIRSQQRASFQALAQTQSPWAPPAPITQVLAVADG